MKVPVGATLIFDAALSSVSGIFPPENPNHDAHWVSGNQPNASTTITDAGEIECAVWDVAELGKSGARAFWTNNGRWDVFANRVGKHDLITWTILFPRLIPVAQGANQFGLLVDGKMGANGIWGINFEVVNGQARHWIQNQSGAGVYHSSKPADPIPVNVAYPCSLEILWATDKTGFMKFRYANTLIEAQNVCTLGPDGTLGLAWGLYVGDAATVLPTNQRYSVRHAAMQVWQLP